MQYSILCPPFDNTLIEDLASLHKDKEESFKEYIKFLLLFPVDDKENHLSDSFYLIVGYFNQQLISTVFLYIPNGGFPQVMRFSFIANIIVASEFKHKGIASKSIQICESICKKRHCSGILLATSNENLKSNFYSKLDFYKYRSDKWLLHKEITPKMTAIKISYFIHKITPFDLASIQSLCAFPHCKIIDDIIEVVDCCEVEEDFIDQIMKYPNQFLFFESISKNNTPTIAWIIYEKGTCKQIVINEINPIELNSKVSRIKDSIKTIL